MIFLGILWVASCLNFPLTYSLSGSLVSDYLSLAFKNKPPIAINKPLVNPASQVQGLVKIPPAPLAEVQIPFSKDFSSNFPTTVANSLMDSPPQSRSISAASNNSDRNRPDPRVASWWLKSGEDNFCQTETTSLESAWANLLPVDGDRESLANFLDSGVTKIPFSQQIFQIFNNLWRWQDYFIKQPNPQPATVLVMRSDALIPDQARRNFWLISQQSPENALSDSQQSQGQALTLVAPKFQVWLKRHLIAEFDQKLEADLMAHRLQQLLSSSHLDARQLQPGLVENNVPAVKLGDRLLFVVDDALRANIRTDKDLVAIKVTNSLRLALGIPALELAEAQAIMYNLAESEKTINGLASWYGSYFHGRETANGEKYNQYALTVAHPSLPFGTYLKITNHKNNKSVIVRVNDRGPYIADRVLDLSTIAARCVESVESGVVMVTAVVMQPRRSNLSNNVGSKIAKK